MKTYAVKQLPPATWWERGSVRYCALSYTLWVKQIRRDFKPFVPKK